MQREIMRAHVSTLMEWAREYRTADTPGASEAAFRLQRAANQIALLSGDARPTQETEEPALPEPAVEEPAPG